MLLFDLVGEIRQDLPILSVLGMNLHSRNLLTRERIGQGFDARQNPSQKFVAALLFRAEFISHVNFLNWLFAGQEFSKDIGDILSMRPTRGAKGRITIEVDFHRGLSFQAEMVSISPEVSVNSWSIRSG